MENIEQELENIFKYNVLKDDYPHNIKELNEVNNALQEIFNKYNIVNNIINKNIKNDVVYSVGCGKNYNIVHYKNNYTEIFYSFEYIDGYKWKLVTDITEEDIVLKHINYENMFKKDYNYNTDNNISSDIADDEYFNKNFYSYDNFRQKYYSF